MFKKLFFLSFLGILAQTAFAVGHAPSVCPSTEAVHGFKSLLTIPYGFHARSQKMAFIDIAMESPSLAHSGWFLIMHPTLVAQSEKVHDRANQDIQQLQLAFNRPYYYKPFDGDEDSSEENNLSICAYHSSEQPRLSAVALYLEDFNDEADAIRQLKVKSAFFLK